MTTAKAASKTPFFSEEALWTILNRDRSKAIEIRDDKVIGKMRVQTHYDRKDDYRLVCTAPCAMTTLCIRDSKGVPHDLMLRTTTTVRVEEYESKRDGYHLCMTSPVPQIDPLIRKISALVWGKTKISLAFITNTHDHDGCLGVRWKYPHEPYQFDIDWSSVVYKDIKGKVMQRTAFIQALGIGEHAIDITIDMTKIYENLEKRARDPMIERAPKTWREWHFKIVGMKIRSTPKAIATTMVQAALVRNEASPVSLIAGDQYLMRTMFAFLKGAEPLLMKQQEIMPKDEPIISQLGAPLVDVRI